MVETRPADGTWAMADEYVDLLLEGLVADYRRRWRFTSGDDMPFSGYEPERYEDHTEAYLTELQRRLPGDEPPLDLRHVETARDLFVCSMIVVTARRALVISCSYLDPCARPEVAEAPLEQVQFAIASRAGGVRATGTGGPGMLLTLDKERRAWLEAFRASARVPQGRLVDLGSRSRRNPRVPAADWYPDPSGHAELRFWDGMAWADDVHGRP